VIIPQTVYEELKLGGLPEELEQVNYTEDAPEKSVSGELDPGEAAAISIAEEENGILLTDDLAAREEAENRGIPVHGSIGIIAQGHLHGDLPLDAAIDKMLGLQEKSSLFVTDAIIEHATQQLREQSRNSR
jgi:predicted nucleic acid-binding protein